MRQGFYTAIGWGTLLSEAQSEALAEASVYQILEKHFLGRSGSRICLENSYESKPAWLAYLAADNDGNLCTGYDPKSPDGDYWPILNFCMNYQSCRLSELEQFLEQGKSGILAECQGYWRDLQTELKPVFDLPDGELLLINDYQ